MSPPDPRSVVRIAIALATLKHKPKDQSTASYLLDLQSHFPVSTKVNDTRDWRTYALELEKQLAALKAQRDADQELLSKFPTDASQAASTSDAPPPKKKSKKNPQREPEWSWDQSHADWSHFLSSQYPSSPSLVAAYASLKGALAAPNADPLSYASRLTDAILRAFDTIHLFLFSPSLLTRIPPSAPSPEHIDSARIALTSPLLMYVLRIALHALVCSAQDSTKPKRQRSHTIASDIHAYVDKVLDHLLECVLLALLRALVPLCSARLAPLLSVPPKKDRDKPGRGVGRGKDKDKDKDTNTASVDPPKMTDVRTDVFTLIAVSLEALDALPPMIRPTGLGAGVSTGTEQESVAAGVRDRLGLETIRELEALYGVPPPLPSSPPPPPPPPSLPPAPPPLPSSPPATPSEPPQPTPAPTSTSTPTPTPMPTPLPSSAQSLSQTRPRTLPESHAKRLERLAGTREERIRALATRDAGWFLASTLNLCVTPALAPAPRLAAVGRTENPGGLLREALLDRIGKLVRSVSFGECRHASDSPSQQPSDPDVLDGRVERNATSPRLAIDPVCQNMLWAICERAMACLVSS